MQYVVADVLHVRKPKWLYVKILRRYTSEITESRVAFITNKEQRIMQCNE